MQAASTVETRIHDAIHDLTSAEKRVARGLLANYPTVGLGPVAEFATASGASAATVLRFVGRLGFGSYPEFQRALRDELEERVKSPLERAHATRPSGEGDFLDTFLGQVEGNLHQTAETLPRSEFEAACRRLADPRHACHLIGGRFTDAFAAYLEAHLRIVRSDVRRLDGRSVVRQDQLLDVRPGGTIVAFDVRRYDPGLLDTVRQAAARKAFVIVVTDEWLSPAARFARIVLPCRIAIGRAWDSNTPVMALTEAIIARVTELSWKTAEGRMSAFEMPK